MQPEHEDREPQGGELAPPREAGSADAGAGVPAGELHGVPPKVGRTRTSTTWGVLASGLVFLVVILVFILENLRTVRVHFFGATWSIPLGVDLLLAAVLGGLVMCTAGAARILQLRRVARAQGGGGVKRFGRNRLPRGGTATTHPPAGSPR